MAEILLLLAVIAVPLAIGALTAYLARPWWWRALLAITLAFVAPLRRAGSGRIARGRRRSGVPAHRCALRRRADVARRVDRSPAAWHSGVT
jgi:hypothetical protein